MNAQADTRIDELDLHDCWALLRSVTVGRLAVHTAAGLDIFPVNFVVDRGSIVFRTAEGTKLAGALADTPVAFEVDGTDPARGEAWSVVVKGRARLIQAIEDLVDTVALPLVPWHPAAKHCFVQIDPHDVTGRRFPLASTARWHNALADAPRAPRE